MKTKNKLRLIMREEKALKFAPQSPYKLTIFINPLKP